MKKVILIFLAIGLMGCGSSKTVRDSKKVIKGDWTLSTITYSKTGKYNVTLLNDTSKDCFEGSTWEFVSNNDNISLFLLFETDNKPFPFKDTDDIETSQEGEVIEAEVEKESPEKNDNESESEISSDKE